MSNDSMFHSFAQNVRRLLKTEGGEFEFTVIMKHPSLKGDESFTKRMNWNDTVSGLPPSECIDSVEIVLRGLIHRHASRLHDWLADVELKSFSRNPEGDEAREKVLAMDK